MESFQITIEQVATQLAEATATSEDGDHLVQMDYHQFILSSEGARTCQQASAYLGEGEWAQATYVTCGVPDCVRPEHVTGSAAKAQAAKDAADLELVHAHTQAVTLADLYRKAKKRGLVAPARDY